MGSRRPQRVASAIQQAISMMMLTESRDEVLSGVEVTAVRVTPDLQLAHVYYVLSGVDPVRAAAALERAQGYLRRGVAERVDLRRAPQLVFHYDASLDRGREMESLLRQLRDAGEMGEPGALDEAPSPEAEEEPDDV